MNRICPIGVRLSISIWTALCSFLLIWIIFPGRASHHWDSGKRWWRSMKSLILYMVINYLHCSFNYSIFEYLKFLFCYMGRMFYDCISRGFIIATSLSIISSNIEVYKFSSFHIRKKITDKFEQDPRVFPMYQLLCRSLSSFHTLVPKSSDIRTYSFPEYILW